ncbi:MAG: ABC transporter permease [Verrucomicrobiae bacterium]|nr:ABC transporter permease [Verrucomicrobiae bacterium]
MNDLKHALRQIRRNPGFSLGAISILAVGLAANAVVFGLVDAALLRPLASVRDPDRLVALEVPHMGSAFSRDNLEVLRQESGAFEGFAAFSRQTALLRSGNGQERADVEFVSDGYFALLGTPPQWGRTLDGSDRGEPHVVIGDRLWRSRFDADPDIVGQPLVVNGEPFTIVGVAAPGFGGMRAMAPVAAWLSMDLAEPHLPAGSRDWDRRWLEVFGRMAPGVRVETALGSLAPLEPGLLEAWMIENQRRLRLSPCGRGSISEFEARGAAGRVSMFLFAVVGLVVAVACANLACLLLSRGIGRHREMAVRLALGASRGRLVRQMLAETLLLSLAGGLLGLLLAVWGARASAWVASGIPGFDTLDLTLPLDGRVIGYTLMAAVAVAGVCGLYPAWRTSDVACHTAIKDDNGGVGPGRRGFDPRSVLVALQVAICVVLLVGGGLMLRSLGQLRSLPLTFDFERCVVVGLWERDTAISEAEHRRVRRELLASVRDMPGVATAAIATHPPLGPGSSATSVSAVENRRSVSGTFFGAVSPGFFDTLKIPVLAGRDFGSRDIEEGSDVVVVNRSLAEALWPEQSALGRRLGFFGREYEVIGVVADAYYWQVNQKPGAGIYLHEGQGRVGGGGFLVARSSRETAPLRTMLAQRVQQSDPGGARPYAADYEDLIAVGYVRQRVGSWVLGLGSLVGLMLVSVGLYGVLGYHVARRTREVGVRIALGATRRAILLVMLRRGLAPVLVGIVLGGGLSLYGAGFLRALLHETSPADPMTLTVVVFLMLAVGTLACWFPARRAARIQPMEALRTE